MVDYFSLDYWTEPTSVVVLAGLAVALLGIFVATRPSYAPLGYGPSSGFAEALPSPTRSRDSIPLNVYGY